MDNKIVKAYQEYFFGTFESKVPEHTQESMIHYLIGGYPPSGFMESILEGDLHRAVRVADMANKPKIHTITLWVLKHYPPVAVGGEETIQAWCSDANGRRSKYVERISKEMTWDKLNG